MHGQVFEVVTLRINAVLLAEFGGKGEWLENKHDPHDI